MTFLNRKLRAFSNQRCLQVMALSGIVFMLIFCYIPMLGIVIAFKDYSITSTIFKAPWAGLKYFIEYVNDDMFWLSIRNTLAISLLKLVIGFPMPIIFALLLNELYSVRFKKIVQSISYLPHFISWVVLGGIMISWLSETGLITRLLVGSGLFHGQHVFLAEPEYFWGIAVISDVWKELGWNAIIYIAAMAGINPELYEAAIIDGAGRIQKLIHITFPGILGAVSVLFVLNVGYLMNSNFDQIFVLKNPLTMSTSEVLDIFMYRVGISLGRFPIATAAGLLKSLIALGLLVLANKVTRKLTGVSLF